MSASPSRPIIVVTGGNTGLGFGICYRLIDQLSSKSPSDAHPRYPFHTKLDGLEDLHVSYDGLTLVLACRSVPKAEAARAELHKLFFAKLKSLRGHDAHTDEFLGNLTIDIIQVDLSDVKSIFNFADSLSQKYPYVSHLICNAGLASFNKIDWLACSKQMLTHPIAALSRPTYYIQNTGEKTADGLGWVWQCNVFGHYVMYRCIQHLLSNYEYATGARVIWMSSHEATPRYYDPEDWQLVITDRSYESSKYQMDMISLHLDQLALAQSKNDGPVVRHISVLPGVVVTNIANALVGSFQTIAMYFTFYLARFFGSPDHLISPYKAAVSAVHLCLVPLALLPVASAMSSSNGFDPSFESASFRYGSQTNMLGKEYVRANKLTRSRDEQLQTKQLLDHCEDLLTRFCATEGRPVPPAQV